MLECMFKGKPQASQRFSTAGGHRQAEYAGCSSRCSQGLRKYLRPYLLQLRSGGSRCQSGHKIMIAFM
ncbi:hypothetical protein D3C79_961370 [compost metagenome]